jgi:alpha-ribazole phosphatase
VQINRATELILIRHAPALTDGRLCGRTDVAADTSESAANAALARAVGTVDRLIVSPARRCLATAAALWPDAEVATDAALWEQDFGVWEGLSHAALPDLGPLPRKELADHCPPGGESFADLCARVWPALRALPEGRTALVVHAGTIRAALAMALSEPADALAFEIASLSLSHMSRHGEVWSIGAVNRCAAWG